MQVSILKIEEKLANKKPLNKYEMDYYARHSYFNGKNDIYNRKPQIKEELFMFFVPTIKKLAYKYSVNFPNIPYEEFLQSAYTDVWTKMDDYQAKKIKTKDGHYQEIMFSTYMSFILKDSLQKCIANNTKIYLGTMNLKYLQKIKFLQEQGLSFSEIAKLLNTSENRVISILDASTSSNLNEEINEDGERKTEAIDFVQTNNGRNIEYELRLRDLINFLNKAGLNERQCRSLLAKSGYIEKDRSVSRATYASAIKVAINKIQSQGEEFLNSFKEFLYELNQLKTII